MLEKTRIRLTLQYCLLIFSVGALSVLITYYLIRQEIISGLKETHEDLVAHQVVALDHQQLATNIFLAHESRIFEQIVSQWWMIFLLIALIAFGVAFFLARKAFLPIEKTYEAQANFIADASHELKTPLTGLMTRTEVALLKPKPTVSELKSVLEKNLSSIRYLHRLIVGLLELTKIELGKIHFEHKQIQLDKLLGEIYDDIKLRYGEKKVKLITKLSSKTIYSDPVYLRQLLTVLLENAYKFTDSGSVRTEVKQLSSGFEIIISDTGKGLEQSEIPYIFDRFYQSKDVDQSSFGMGLAVANRLVKAWGGSIKVNSKKGKGTQFRIILTRQKIET